MREKIYLQRKKDVFYSVLELSIHDMLTLLLWEMTVYSFPITWQNSSWAGGAKKKAARNGGSWR
jgi:hypothetical protein